MDSTGILHALLHACLHKRGFWLGFWSSHEIADQVSSNDLRGFLFHGEPLKDRTIVVQTICWRLTELPADTELMSHICIAGTSMDRVTIVATCFFWQ